VVDSRFLRLNQEQIDVINLLGIEWEQIKSNSPATEIPIPTTGTAPIATSLTSLDLPSRDGIHAVSHIARTTPALFSVVSEEELQRIIKISSECESVSLSNGPTITMFNGRDAEIRDTGSRPFVTAVKEVQVEGKEKARASQPVFSIFETGIRMRVRPVVTASTIEVDCHLQLKEITDVKVLHRSKLSPLSLRITERRLSRPKRFTLSKSKEPAGFRSNRPPKSLPISKSNGAFHLAVLCYWKCPLTIWTQLPTH